MDDVIGEINNVMVREGFFVHRYYGDDNFRVFFSCRLSCIVIYKDVNIFKRYVENKLTKFNTSRIIFYQAKFGELNIPKIQYYYIREDYTFFFFEGNFCKSLKEIIHSERLDENVVLKYTWYLLEQINVLHSSDYVHGNLNPGYMVPFDRNDGILILDAFLSVKTNNTQRLLSRKRNIHDNKYTRPGVSLITKEGDLFSLGLILIEMCLSEIPFERSEYTSLTREKIEIKLKGKISSDLIEIIEQLMVDKVGAFEILQSYFKKEGKAARRHARRPCKTRHLSKININCNIFLLRASEGKQ